MQPTPTCLWSYMVCAADSSRTLPSHASFTCFSTIAKNMKWTSARGYAGIGLNTSRKAV